MGTPANRILRAPLSALTWLVIAVLLIVWLPLMAVTRLLDHDPARYRTGRLFRQVGGLLTRLNPAWRITTTGELPADPRRPFVVVCNHQGNADIPVVSTLPWDMKWVAKSAMFRVPVAGWMMRLAGDIPVDRSDSRSRSLVLLKARYYLERHCSVMFMPEGTRSRDGRVRMFQDGAFRLAIEVGVPILPLALDGTRDALPRKGWIFGPVDCRLHVFPPVETTGLTPAQAPELRERVREDIITQIAAWRGVDRPEVDGAAAGVEEGANSPARADAGGAAG